MSSTCFWFIFRKMVVQGSAEPNDTFKMVIDNIWKQEAKPSKNAPKYAIYYPQITSLFSEQQADGLCLH